MNRYEGGFTFDAGGSRVAIYADPHDEEVDLHIHLSGTNGNAAVFQQLTPGEAFELSGALRDAAKVAKARVESEVA